MKKTGLFKILMFVLIAIVLITWFVPSSYFESGSLVEYGSSYKLGFFDFFQLIFGTFQFKYFLQIAFFLLSVGAFYGVLAKTGKYRAWIEKITNAFKGIEYVFLICVAVVLAALSSVFSYGLLLFIFIPLLIGIIVSMGYNKITAFFTTFGAILIGQIGSTVGYNINGTLNETIGTKTVDGIVYKLLLLLIPLGLLIFYIVKAKRNDNKKSESKEAIDNTLYIGEKKSNKYSVVPIIVAFAILFVLMVLGCTSWANSFNVTIFEDFHEAVMGVKISDITYALTHWLEVLIKLVFKNFHTFTNIHNSFVETSVGSYTLFAGLLGTINEFGSWFYAEMSVILLMISLIVGRFFRMKHSEIFENMAHGASKLLPTAGLIILSYGVLYFAGSTFFYPTIAKYILGATSKFNLFFSSIAMILGSAIHVDMAYIVSFVVPQIAAQDANSTVVMLLCQGMYGVTMLIAPTSVMLILGLSYLEIPYTEWVKKTWKYILTILAVIVVIIFIAMII